MITWTTQRVSRGRWMAIAVEERNGQRRVYRVTGSRDDIMNVCSAVNRADAMRGDDDGMLFDFTRRMMSDAIESIVTSFVVGYAEGERDTESVEREMRQAIGRGLARALDILEESYDSRPR